MILPIFQPLHQPGPYWILNDIVPLLRVALMGTQHVIKEFPLPEVKWCRRSGGVIAAIGDRGVTGANRRAAVTDRGYNVTYAFTGPLLPTSHEIRKTLRFRIRTAEKVDVIGHDYVSPYGPTVLVWGGLPFLDQDGRYIDSVQSAYAIVRACGNEIDGFVDPDLRQPTEVRVLSI